MKLVIDSLRAEYLRYKAVAESALAQLTDSELTVAPPASGNSVAVLCRHVGGNLRSRFTDFLTSDGEKPWRQREEEFSTAAFTREELMASWNAGWSALVSALDELTDAQLGDQVTIRGQAMSVVEALHRALAHVASHVGQIVLVARSLRGAGWTYLSIPPGQSEAYNRNPQFERASSHADRLADKPGRPGA